MEKSDRELMFERCLWNNKLKRALKELSDCRTAYNMCFETYYIRYDSANGISRFKIKTDLRRTMQAYMRAIFRVEQIRNVLKELIKNNE